jgi:hypothetical protein
LSTILKSLKKLEQEKEARQYTGTVSDYRGPGSVSVHGAKRSWIRSVGFRQSLVAVIILGLGATSLYFYSQSQETQHQAGSDNPPQLTARNTDRRPTQKVPLPEGARAANVTPRKPPVSIQKRINKDRPLDVAKRTPSTPRKFKSPPVSKSHRAGSSAIERRRPISKADDVRSGVNSAKKHTPTNARQRANPQALVPARNVAKPSPSRQFTSQPVAKKPAKPSAESYQNVSTLTDGRLKVQAIVWSRIPEDRMTVINSRVLHEGDSVDGFTLVVIQPDDVVVRESGGVRWKVLFGHP